MTSIYNDGFEIQPVLPKLRVLKLEGEQEMKELAQLLRDDPHLFPGLPDSYKKGVAYRDNLVISRPYGKSGQPHALAEKGNYLISSDNGYRHISPFATIELGLFECFPDELFIPVQGQKL